MQSYGLPFEGRAYCLLLRQIPALFYTPSTHLDLDLVHDIVHRVAGSPSQALPASGTHDTQDSHKLISPTVNLFDRLGNHVKSMHATEQQISKQYALRTAPQQPQPDRRGVVVAFQNAGRHPQARVMVGLPRGISRVADRSVLPPEEAEHALLAVQQPERCYLDLVHVHRVACSPSQALPASGTHDTQDSHKLISPTVNLFDRLGNHVKSMHATEQQISKQYALRTAPQQPGQRRGDRATGD